MAEPLKNQFGISVPDQIAAMIIPVYPAFARAAFMSDVTDGYEAQNLMQRARQIALALGRHLPGRYEQAIEILLASLGTKQVNSGDSGKTPFLYLPHTFFVAEHGLGHFDVSMQAQYELTQRFTAEFSIRPFLERYPQQSLALLKQWTADPSAHVRRLVSEGTRPRLPWAPRLRDFQQDPRPVLALLELLKDDPELYVRRSVANNLNDIGKDHPALLVDTARTWLKDAPEPRRWVVRHALRSAIKRAEPGALNVLGFGGKTRVVVSHENITPKRPKMGGKVSIAFEVSNTGSCTERVLIDFRVFYVKANGKPSPKVFKLKTVTLAPQESARLTKTISLAEMTTRKHYPGTHRIELLLNGTALPLGTFELGK